MIEVEYLKVRDIGKDNTFNIQTEKNFTEWLLNSDVHFILGHPHQGILFTNLKWSAELLYQELVKLHYHRGFPNGKQLRCPVFTQDKFGYIGPLVTHGFFLPTMKLDVHALNAPTEEVITSIAEFLSSSDDGTHAYIVKSPFITNSQGIKKIFRCVDGTTDAYTVLADKIVQYLNRKVQNEIRLNDESGNIIRFIIPYLLLQPYLENNREVKVFMTGGKPR